MACKPKTNDDIKKKFTFKTIPSIEVYPNYEGINMATLRTQKRGGHHGNIGSIMKPTLYKTLTTAEWTNPPNLRV